MKYLCFGYDIIANTFLELPAGYPQLASILGSDDGYRFYRRFGTVRNRLLLVLQQEIAEHEKRLKEADKQAPNSDEVKASLLTLKDKLKEYGEQI